MNVIVDGISPIITLFVLIWLNSNLVIPLGWRGIDSGGSGIAEATAPYAGWGTRWVDLDNDGWKDLFIAQGHVLDTIELTSDHLTYLQPPLVLRRRALEGWAEWDARFGILKRKPDVNRAFDFSVAR